MTEPPPDAWEDWSNDLYGSASRELVATLRIKYRDGRDQVTHRTITVERYSRASADGGLLSAFCHMRQSRRPFRFSRIEHAVDMEGMQRIDRLGDWLDARYATTPAGHRDFFLESHISAIGALHYVAKADGAFRARERAVVERFCIDCGATPEVAAAVTAVAATWDAPSAVTFGQDLRAVAPRDEAYRMRVHAAAVAIVGTDKTVRDAETHALKRLVKELALKA